MTSNAVFTDDVVETMEADFWRSLQDGGYSIKYANNLESLSEEPESSPPRKRAKTVASGVDLNELGDILCRLRTEYGRQYPGLNEQTYFVGKHGAAFGSHQEDLDFCSINYQVCGAPEVWWCIRAESVDLFESLFGDASGYSHLRGKQSHCNNVLRHKLLVFPPELLLQHGINVTRVVQRPGEYVLTFPRVAATGSAIDYMSLSQPRGILLEHLEHFGHRSRYYCSNRLF
ncbi:Lysine-specific demethylase 4B [Cryptotrichosporon argae]